MPDSRARPAITTPAIVPISAFLVRESPPLPLFVPLDDDGAIEGFGSSRAEDGAGDADPIAATLAGVARTSIPVEVAPQAYDVLLPSPESA